MVRNKITSSILTGLYFSDALISNPYDELKNIYFFLGSINALVASYALFSESEYEKFYYGENSQKMVLEPVVMTTESSQGLGLRFTMNF